MLFETAFNKLMEFEGGGKTHTIPGDTGGTTKWGVSQRAFPKLDIPSLTKEKAMEIYKENYWTPCKCEMLNCSLQYIMFDTAVNMGVKTSITILQQTMGISTDGKFGPNTMVASFNCTKEKYALYRMFRYANIVDNNPSQVKFLEGWMNRVKTIVEDKDL